MARASRTSQARAARQAKMLYDMCAMAIVAGRADLDGADEVGFDIELPMFTVGRARRTRQRASADAPPIRSFGAGGAANARTVALAGIRCETSRALRKRSS